MSLQLKAVWALRESIAEALRIEGVTYLQGIVSLTALLKDSLYFSTV